MKKKKRHIDGLLFVDKPIGLSSNQCLQKIKWIYQSNKAGHGGTLDPFANGALVVLFGDATKFAKYYLEGDKCYQVTAQFGCETTTDDSEGEIVRQKAVPNLENVDWQNVLQHFHGLIEQIPPIYSALKVDGKRAYALARQGKDFELESRKIKINYIEVINIDEQKCQVTFNVSCGGGTYIRALIRDIARAIDSAAHAVYLRRTQISDKVEQLYSLEALIALREANDFAALNQLLLPLTDCIKNLPTLKVPQNKLKYVKNGNSTMLDSFFEDGEYALFEEDQFFGVGEMIDGRLIPQRLCRVKQNETSL